MTTADLFAEPTPGRVIYSVSGLNHEVRDLLEGNFATVWIEGEISNLARPASGHAYFSLKDESSQIRCALFKSRGSQLGFDLDNGMLVLARARVSLYEARGDYQLIVEQMEPAGEGALRLAFERLKQSLDAQGLFETEHKLALPSFPHRLGIVTSPTGAAVRDVLSVVKRRFPALPVVIYPTLVQGPDAPAAIAAMIKTAVERRECDLLILTRGGGSLEDLWAFNDERVARAIYACDIPLISAVGHQIDFTIADFVADLRAPTPSAGAELASPDQHELLAIAAGARQRLMTTMSGTLQRLQVSLSSAARQLRHPGRRLQELAQRLDDARHQIDVATQMVLANRRGSLATLAARLKGRSPMMHITLKMSELSAAEKRLRIAMQSTRQIYGNRLEILARALDAVGPQATLARGYAIISQNGQILRDARNTQPGAKLSAKLAHGSLTLSVDEIDIPGNDSDVGPRR
jgi:exodeoxyribonuclease VII large subunit